MRCTKCFSVLAVDNRFCPLCGTPVQSVGEVTTSNQTESVPEVAQQPSTQTSQPPIPVVVVKPKRPWFKKKRFIIPIILMVFLFWSSGNAVRNIAADSGTGGQVEVADSATSVDPTPSESTVALPEGKWFEDGTYLVGSDIQAGTYRTLEPVLSGCYWEIDRAGSNGQDIIANDNVDGGYPTITLTKNEEISSSDCGTFVSTDVPVFDIKILSAFGPGTWSVGVDIQPGKYKTETSVNGMSCYWEIDTAGTNGEDIIANDNVDGGFARVTLSKGQDFSSSDCGNWVQDK
jgi:hypothetical protein